SPPSPPQSGQTTPGAVPAYGGAVPPAAVPVPPGSPAGPPASGPPYQRPLPPPGSPYAAAYSGGSAPPYGAPASGGPYGVPQSGPPATPGEAPGEPVASTTMMPGQPGGYPLWTPPAAAPKKMPTGVKVLIGGVAAVALALCSGVTGAVVATTLDENTFSIPVSTNAAPVVDRSTLSGVAAKTLLSVVSVSTGSGEGSGVILREDGYILTNNHVVESARGGSVTVTLSDGKKVRGTVRGTDPRTDLAVVKADVTGLKPATFANSDQVAVGDTVLAIGSPLGLQGSVTSGIISAKDRTIRAGQTSGSLSGLLQTDAPINPGNSGGALVNTNGEVVGINTAIATSGTGEGNIGVGFAIPSNKAKQVAEQLIAGQKVRHPFLGVQVTPNDTGGAKIEQITAGSPAEAAGLQVGDIITKFGNRVVNDSDDLVSAVQAGAPGQKVTVEFSRNGSPQTATVTLGEAS
uniref:S1C family serine protease n=1 Tax=Allorhizocola rhizosphaerae TaxID=1872709 RepID=UPI001B8B977C